MPVDGPSYLAGRTDERVLTMFCQVLTIDACGQALTVSVHATTYIVLRLCDQRIAVAAAL